METILNTRLEAIFTKIFKQNTAPFSAELKSTDVKGWDSLRHLQLMVALEKEFKIKILPKDAVRLKSVIEITTYLSNITN